MRQERFSPPLKDMDSTRPAEDLYPLGAAAPLAGIGCVIEPRSCHHGRDRTHQATPDLFSTDMVRDASPPPTRRVSATEAATDTASKRHVLPNDLPNAVKYLTDRELDLLITASVEEAKRRGRLLPSMQPNSTDKSVRKQSPSKDQRQAEVAKVSLTRGQVNAVRAALKAGIKPSQIARQFGISQSDVRKVLASDTATQRVT
jgi:hypothetical protein